MVVGTQRKESGGEGPTVWLTYAKRGNQRRHRGSSRGASDATVHMGELVPPDISITPVGTFSGPPSCGLNYKRNLDDSLSIPIRSLVVSPLSSSMAEIISTICTQ